MEKLSRVSLCLRNIFLLLCTPYRQIYFLRTSTPLTSWPRAEYANMQLCMGQYYYLQTLPYDSLCYPVVNATVRFYFHLGFGLDSFPFLTC